MRTIFIKEDFYRYEKRNITLDLDGNTKNNIATLPLKSYFRMNSKRAVILANLLLEYFKGCAEWRKYILFQKATEIGSSAIDTSYIPMTAWNLKNYMSSSKKDNIILVIYAMLTKKYW